MTALKKKKKIVQFESSVSVIKNMKTLKYIDQKVKEINGWAGVLWGETR